MCIMMATSISSDGPPIDKAGDQSPPPQSNIAAAAPLLDIQPLRTHTTAWTPSLAKVTLNVEVDACIVPSMAQDGAARVDTTHLVVLDNFFGEAERLGLMEFLIGAGWEQSHLPPPETTWEKATSDAAFLPRTWGLKDEALQQLAASDLPAKLEIQARICKLYPEFMIIHQPSQLIQSSEPLAASELPLGLHPTYTADELGADDEPSSSSNNSHTAKARVDCNSFVANAAVHGDCFAWHVDADPSTFPHSLWTQQHGHYFNREPGKPLFCSLLLYLDNAWGRALDAETLFLDAPSDCGIFVRPKKYRAVLMESDILHRLSPPSQVAAGRPRYSLVWKLVMLPKPSATQLSSISRPEWGNVLTSFGSAARLAASVKQLAEEHKAEARKRKAGALT